MQIRKISIILSLVCVLLAETLSADVPKVKKGELLRIGGQFRISAIQAHGDHNFVVRFQSESQSKKQYQLVLHSDHVHSALKQGMSLRLSAEVLTSRADELEVTQVLLFLPNKGSNTPIWILSSRYPASEFRGARKLDMHAKEADFQVL